MTQDVLCPQCQKRYTLPANPPDTYACTQCGTVMDLSAFGGTAAPAQASASEAPASAHSTPGPSTRRGARRRAPARDPRDAPPMRRSRARSGNAGVMWGIAGVGALALLVIAVAIGRGDDDTPAPEPTRRTAIVTDAPPVVEPTTTPTPPKSTKMRKRHRTRRGKPNVSRVKLKIFEWSEEIDAETRRRVETALANLYRGSRDAVDARDEIVAFGRPICGRLISEFKTIEQTEGFDNRNGASMASVIDGTLRRIDGFIEREFEETAQIRAWGIYAAPSFITRIAKRWTWWWEHEEWKTNPQEPWDPHEDVDGTMRDGFRRKGDAKKKKKKKGFSKPAGSN